MPLYQPHLVGVVHIDGYEDKVIDYLLKLHPKKVGFEVAASDLAPSGIGFMLGPNGFEPIRVYEANYYQNIRRALARHGIKVVPLVNQSLMDRIQSWGVERMEELKISANAAKKVNSLEVGVVFDTLTRDIQRNAEKEKPDAIVTGAFHAMVLRKDMKIPKERFRAFYSPRLGLRFSMWLQSRKRPELKVLKPRRLKAQFLKDVIALRRFRRERTKKKKEFHSRRAHQH